MQISSRTRCKGIERGEFVHVRGRHWLVDEIEAHDEYSSVVSLSCIDDDAQGDDLRILWEAEVDAYLLNKDPWRDALARDGADDAETFAAYLRTIRWQTASAADRSLFQAPFRAGIRLDAYQLAPLAKALRLPRVNLLIADDVGLGKTIEAALVVRELLLRRRIDFVLVAAPPSMVWQWQDELKAKFGLSFEIIDREKLAVLRRLRGFSVNPWSTGSRFIISHRLLTDETYVAGLRDLLGEFRSRALLILDEAHHAAPASGARYAVDSQFTKAVRELAQRFEHRLFLSATPHNGHSNSFSALLEVLDAQRFTRGVPVRASDLEPVMVRRLKADLRALDKGSFAERVIEPIIIDGLPMDEAELDLARRLADYQELRERRIAELPQGKKAQARLVFSGLQQRLLSSVAAFAKTIAVHRRTLETLIADAEQVSRVSVGLAERFARSTAVQGDGEETAEDEDAEARDELDELQTAEQASLLGGLGAERDALQAELAAVNDILAIAEAARTRADARIHWLASWIADEMHDESGRWNERRLIIFTEYEDTRRWLENRLREVIACTDQADERVAVFSGMTNSDTREAIKQAFNADPHKEPIRILLCTDAAREGINLQRRCHDLVHFDLPWNPSRLEQRNGRIDRKLQPEPKVFCRYFVYAQREADVVLQALVRKTEVIQRQLGSAGQVIADRITDRLTKSGMRKGEAQQLLAALDAEDDDPRIQLARAELDESDAKRRAKVESEIDDLRRLLERSRKRVGVEADELKQVVGAALNRAGFALDEAAGAPVSDVGTFAIDPQHPAFARDAAWQDTFDDLRARRRGRREGPNEWRRRVPPRRVAFEPPIQADGADADDVVQIHLEHRLVRRLLGQFLSQGFQSGLKRATVILGKGAQPRVILLGRIALYGPAAARLHEEIIPVTALWTEAGRGAKPLKPFGERGEETTLQQLEDALVKSRPPAESIVERAISFAEHDVQDLLPALEERSRQATEKAKQQLVERGEQESASLKDLLERQRTRIEQAEASFDDRQRELFGAQETEQRQLRADRSHWLKRLDRLDREIEKEPARVQDGYRIVATRLEPVGLVYLWPATG